MAILGVEKVVFWTFSKLFWRCLGSVWALFSVLKGQLLVVFLAPNDLENPDYPSKFDPSLTFKRVMFGNFGGQKVVCWAFIKLFGSSLGSVWAIFLVLKASFFSVF